MTVKKKSSAAKSQPTKKSDQKSLAKARLAQVAAEVKLVPGEATIPLAEKPTLRGIGGLREFKIEGTHLTLLCMEDPTEEPTLAQRKAMAMRMIEVGPLLPRYVKAVALRPGGAVTQKDIDPFAGEEKADLENAKASLGANHQPKGDDDHGTPVVSRTGPVKKMLKASAPALENGVPLKKVCANVDIDPKIARRILRSNGGKPGGRWEWSKEEAAKIEVLLKTKYEELKKAGKV
jgi:hypothetical protein